MPTARPATASEPVISVQVTGFKKAILPSMRTFHDCLNHTQGLLLAESQYVQRPTPARCHAEPATLAEGFLYNGHTRHCIYLDGIKGTNLLADSAPGALLSVNRANSTTGHDLLLCQDCHGS